MGAVMQHSTFLAGLTVSNRHDALLRRTNVALLNDSANQLSAAGYSFDAAGRLSAVTDGTNSASYSYLANSALVEQIAFRQSGTLRMTTSKHYDLLNRLTAITNTPSGSGEPAIGFAYAYNTASQRTSVTNADGSFWVYLYDALGQVTSVKGSVPAIGQLPHDRKADSARGK
jgi:YD repeat-containing protein